MNLQRNAVTLELPRSSFWCSLLVRKVAVQALRFFTATNKIQKDGRWKPRQMGIFFDNS